MRRAPSLTAHVVDAPQALRPNLFKWLAAFCVLDCVGAATSPATCTLGLNLACTKNFEYVPVARCGTIPGSLEMRYDPLLCSLARAAATSLNAQPSFYPSSDLSRQAQ